MPKHRPNVWVTREAGAKYSIKEEGMRYAIAKHLSQRVAIRIGCLIAQANRSELFIQGANGRIRARDSHGFDPSSRRG